MSVWIADRVCDYGLSALVDTDAIYLCSSRPRDYNEAVSTYALGAKTSAPGAFFSAPIFEPLGRKVVTASFSGGVINLAGTATRWAAVDTVNGRLLAAGSIANPITVRVGQSFSMQSWEIILYSSLSIPFLSSLVSAGLQTGAVQSGQVIFREWRSFTPSSLTISPASFSFPDISTTIALGLKTSVPIFVKPDLVFNRTIPLSSIVVGAPIFSLPAINNVVQADSSFVTADTTDLRADYYSTPFRADNELVTADNTSYSVDYSS